MRTVHKKIWKRAFDLVAQGKKKFEVRLDDFEIEEGETLILEEWDEKAEQYTGRKIETLVTRVARTKDMPFWTEEEKRKYGFQIIQIERKYHGSEDATRIKLGVYEHYNGGRYEVIGVAQHSETGEQLVTYRALDGSQKLWVRPMAMFTETVDVKRKRVPRFRFVASDKSLSDG